MARGTRLFSRHGGGFGRTSVLTRIFLHTMYVCWYALEALQFGWPES